MQIFKKFNSLFCEPLKICTSLKKCNGPCNDLQRNCWQVLGVLTYVWKESKINLNISLSRIRLYFLWPNITCNELDAKTSYFYLRFNCNVRNILNFNESIIALKSIIVLEIKLVPKKNRWIKVRKLESNVSTSSLLAYPISGSFSDSPNRFMFKVNLFFRQPFHHPCHPSPPQDVISCYTNGANHQDSSSDCLQDVSYLLSLPLRLLPELIRPPSHHYQIYLSVRTPVDRNRFPGWSNLFNFQPPVSSSFMSREMFLNCW